MITTAIATDMPIWAIGTIAIIEAIATSVVTILAVYISKNKRNRRK